MFPEKYQNSNAIQRERVELISVQHNRTVKKEDLNIQIQVKELPKHVADLLARMPFLCVTLTFSLQALIISDLLAFTPKYIETQFGLTSSLGSLISGAVTLPFAGVGIMLGIYMLQYMSALWYLFLHVGALLVYFKRPTTKRLSLYYSILNAVAGYCFPCWILPKMSNA